MPATPLYCAAAARQDAARALAERFALPLLTQRPEQGYWLELGEERLELLTTGKHGAVYAEFVEGAAKHRREQGGGRGQPVAKAIGLKGAKELPYVVDATAGLGRDSFVLAGLAAASPWWNARRWPPRCWPTRCNAPPATRTPPTSPRACIWCTPAPSPG